MNLIISSIVRGVNEQNSIVNSVSVDDCTAEREIIASNIFSHVGRKGSMKKCCEFDLDNL